MNFIGRTREMQTLDRLYQQKGLKGAILYGRRRTGKTSLLFESSKRFQGKVIYFQCLDTVDSINAENLLFKVKSLFPDVQAFGDPSFNDVLSLIFSLAEKEPILLILDEYSYLKDQDLIDSYLQAMIDQHQDLNIKIILSGSYVNIMEHLLDYDHPLHGRFLYQIHLQPFDYYDSSFFYPKASNLDKIRYYSVFGGIPYYLSMINPMSSFEDNVKELLLSENAPLIQEIETIIKGEYSKISNASFVMSLITQGKHSYSDINQAFKAQVEKADLNYILKKLMEMKLLSKTYAINDQRKKNAYYDIEDNLYAFYYQIVYRTLSFKPVMDTDTYFKQFIEEKMNHDFIPHRFEKIATEYLIRRNRTGKMNPVFHTIGSYTYNDSKKHLNGQFDIVTQDDMGNTFYECKFTNERINQSIVDEETRQLKEANVPYYRMGFFSKSGYDLDENDRDLYFTLDDMFCL